MAGGPAATHGTGSSSLAGPNASTLRLAGARAGFTVVELLVVVSIAMVLLGLGAAGYLNLSRRLGLQGLSAEMTSVARQARNFALEERAFARVRFDEAESTLVAVGFRTVGAWHFEEGDLSGAYGRGCTVRGGEYRPGKVGSCLALNGDGESDDHVDCGSEGIWHLPSGLMVEVWVFPLLKGKEQAIFSHGSSYWLKLSAEGFLEGGTGKESISTSPYRLPLLRWSKVALVLEPPWGEIYVDDVIRASQEIEKIRTDPNARLRFGAPQASFYGWLDEPRVLAVAKGEAVRLPPRAKVMEKSLPWFDPGGRLDVGECGTSASFVIDLDGKKLGFKVGSTGEVEEAVQ